MRFFDPIRRDLPFEPGDEIADAAVEGNARRIAQNAARPRYIGKAMADVANAIFVRDLRRDMLLAERFGQLARDVVHGDRTAAADVQHLARCRGIFIGAAATFDDILDMHEVPALPTILEDAGRLAVEQPRREDREHAGIGVGERLARAIDVEEP